LTSYNTQRASGQQLPCPRAAVGPVHLPATTFSKPEVSNCLVPEPWLVLFTYPLQHSASQRSAIALPRNRGWSCSLTRYNIQQARGQQLPCPGTVVIPVKLPATTFSKPESS